MCDTFFFGQRPLLRFMRTFFGNCEKWFVLTFTNLLSFEMERNSSSLGLIDINMSNHPKYERPLISNASCGQT